MTIRRRALARLLSGKGTESGKAATRRHSVRLRPRLEPLEDRRLLAVATDLAAISGLVFDDLTGNGFDAGEEVAGATVNLYRDDGDGSFGSAADALVDSALTAADGRYRFDDLTAGTYFVEQPAQLAGADQLQQAVSPPVVISASDVQGRLVTTIDSFDTTTQSVVDTVNDGVPVGSSVVAPEAEAIGGERDILVNKTSDNGAVQISVNDPLLPGVLSFDSILTGAGVRAVSWDGVDGSAVVLDDTGLGGVDITSAGAATGFRLQIGADLAGATAVIRVYSDDGAGGTAARFSSTTVQIPETGGFPTASEYVPFSAFTATSGGGADFTDVGAIEMEVTGVPNVNGSAELVGAVGPTLFTENFANFEAADLRLAKSVDDPAAGLGQNVSFTVTVSNDGPDAATGVVVADRLPGGVTLISATPSQGTFDDSTGVWQLGSLASGATATLQLLARVDAVGTHTNEAEITASDAFDADSTPGNDVAAEDDQDSATVTVPVADLALTKTIDDATPTVQQNITYTVTVANSGPDAATGISVRETLPAGTTFISSTPSQGTFDSATGIWTVGTIESENAATLQVVVRIDAAGAKTNAAEVLTSDQPDPDSTPGNSVPGEDDQDSVTVTPQVIDLSLDKTVDEPRPEVGENVTFTLTLNNAGPDAATGITLADALPSGVSFVSATPSAGAFDSAANVWTIASLASGAVATLQVVARVDSAATQTNTAEVTAADQFDADSTPGNDAVDEDDRAVATLVPIAADLSLVKSVNNATPNVGQNVTYTVTVSNSGPDAATGVSVRDALAAETDFVSFTPSQGTFDSTTGIWTVGAIASGGSATLQLVATVDEAGTLTNTAQVIASDQADPDSTPGNDVAAEDDQDSVTIDPQLVDLALTKVLDDLNPNRGDEVTYTLSLTNDGPSTATGVAVRDRLPAGVLFVSSTASQGSYDSATGIWTVGSVAAEAVATLEIVVEVGQIQEATNSAEVTAVDQPDADSTPGNGDPTEDDQDSVSFTIQTADLALTKTVDVSSPNRDQPVTFTIVVTNEGPSDAEEVVVRDELPAGLTFVSATETQGTYDSSTGRWTIEAIASGSTATLTLQANATASASTTNVAEIVSVRQFDPDSVPGNGVLEEDDQDAVTVTPALADLSVTAAIDNESPEVGDTITLSFAVTNAGPAAVTGAALQTLLPDGLIFVSSDPDQGTFDPATGIWTVGSLADGETQTLRVVATVDTRGIKRSSIEVIALDQFDPDSTPDNEDETEDDFASVIIRAPRLLSKRLFLAR